MGADNSSQRNQKTQQYGKTQDNDDTSVIFILADWCGHCKTLKASGEIEKLSKMINVYELSDEDKEKDYYMKSVSARGFPAIILKKGSKMKLYAGKRTSNDILTEVRKM